MKQGIHPKLSDTGIVCTTCGTHWNIASTSAGMRVDVCSKCHPFYTGEQRMMDTAGQVDRFMKRLRTSQDQQAEAARRRDDRNKPAPKKPSLLKELYGDDAE